MQKKIKKAIHDPFKWWDEYLQFICSSIRKFPIAYEAIVIFIYRNHDNDDNQRNSCNDTHYEIK